MKRNLPDDITSGLDAEERQKLAGMTEVQREMYLYEKGLNEQQERERASMLTKMAKEEEEVAPEPHSKKSKRGAAKTRKSSKASKSKSKKSSRKRKYEEEEEESSEEEQDDYDEDDEDYEMEREPSDMESEQESDDDFIEREEVPSDVPSDVDDVRESRSRRREEEEYSLDKDIKFEDMKKLQLRRETLTNWANDRFLEDTVKDFYVRIGWGRRGGKACYVMARVVGVREDCTPYDIDSREMTDRMLILHNPNPSSKDHDTKISLVSNGDITPSEFEDYQRHATRVKEYVCRASDLPDMVERLKAAKSHIYTQEEVEERIKKAEKFHMGPLNIDKELSEALTTLKLLRKTKSNKDPDVIELAKKIKALQQMKVEKAAQVTENTRKLRELSSWNETRRVTSAGPSAGAQVSFGKYSSDNKLFQRLPTLPLNRNMLERVKKELEEKERKKKEAKNEEKKPGKDEKASVVKKKSEDDFHSAINRAQEKKKERILQEDLGAHLKRLHNFELDLEGPDPNDESKPSSNDTSASAAPSRNTLFQSLTADDDDAMLDSSTITFSQYMTLSNAAH